MRRLLFVLCILPGAAFAQSFDPSSVMSPECRNGTLKCGFLPAAPDEMRSLPMVDSAFYRMRGLPARVDLTDLMPPVGFQGEQGSCLGWALAYSIRSYQERRANNWQYDSPLAGGRGEKVFSPAFVYNQINGGRDQGSDPLTALRLIVQRGVASWKTMPYNLNDYRTQPGADAIAEALRYRSRGFRRVSTQDLQAIKTELAAGHPVMLGILLHENFYQIDRNNPVYDQLRGRFLGGHAVVIIGYDDQRQTSAGAGALKIQNSYGRNWGENGYGYISYKLLALAGTAAFVVEESDKSAVATMTQGPYLAPREITATRGLPDRVDLAWSGVVSAIAYEVQRSQTGAFEKIGYSVKPQFTDATAKQGVLYRYRIVSIFRSGRSVPESSPVAEGFASVPGMLAVLPRVVGVIAEKLIAVFTPGTIPSITYAQQGQQLRWSPSPGAEYYEVARYEPAYKAFRPVATVREPQYTDPRLEDAVYSVRARSRLGAGAWSHAAISRRPAPVDLKASREIPGRVELRWAAVPGARGYQVLVRDSEKGTILRTENTAKPEFTDTSAAAGRWFGYTVVALFDDSQTVSETVYGQAPARGRTAISGPSDVRAATDGAPQLSWTPVPGAERYYVFRKRERDSDFALYAESTAPSFQDNAAPPGELLYYTVRAESSQLGESGDSNVVAAATPPSAQPDRELNESRGRALQNLPAAQDQRAGAAHPASGLWTTRYWDGSAPIDVRLTLNVTDNSASALVEWPGRIPFRSAASHVAGASSIEMQGLEARMEQGILMVEFTDYGPGPAPMSIAFRRP